MSRGAGEPLSLPGGGGRLSPGNLPAPAQSRLVPRSVPSSFSLFLSSYRPLYFRPFSGCPTPPLCHFLTLPPLHSNLRPRPKPWGQLLLWVSKGRIGKWVLPRGQRSSLRTSEEPERVPLTLLECGQDRSPSKKEVTPHPSRQPQTAVMPHNGELSTTNPEASRPRAASSCIGVQERFLRTVR